LVRKRTVSPAVPRIRRRPAGPKPQPLDDLSVLAHPKEITYMRKRDSLRNTPSSPMSMVPGLVGMAVETNCVYYREMHRAAGERRHDGHSLRSVMDTLDFAALVGDARAGNEGGLRTAVAESARRVQAAGADFVVITSNTGHLGAGAARAAVAIPLLDIRDVAVAELRRRRARQAGLISTGITQRTGLYDAALRAAGIGLITPPPGDAANVDEVIFTELIHGVASESGAAAVQRVADNLRRRGADAVVLACTDLTLLASRLRPASAIVDTTVLHARAAGRLATTAGSTPGPRQEMQ
jgi:aspartate racemase